MTTEAQFNHHLIFFKFIAANNDTI